MNPVSQFPYDVSSLYEEASLYWKFAYPSDSFPQSISDLLSTNLSHPLFDISWINVQLDLFKSLEGRSQMFPTTFSLSFSRFFDSVWYASLLYDAGIRFPDSLYLDWIRRGLPNRVTVLTSGSFDLPAHLSRKEMGEIFLEHSSVEKIWSDLGSSTDTFLVTSSWKVSI